MPPQRAWKASPYATSRQVPMRRMPQRTIYLILSAILILLFWATHSNNDGNSPRMPYPYSGEMTYDESIYTHSGTEFNRLPDTPALPCRSLPGAEDVLVVLRTGSTEFQDKLPVHLRTTLRCYPNYIIFSDYEETFHGEHVYDALEFASEDLLDAHMDFELWRRLRAGGGRSALKRSERSGPISRPVSAKGKPSNPGWKLDKWKFLPMMNRTLHEYPAMKWYLFVETDTYIFWQTVLNYLSSLKWTEPVYMGGQIWIGDIEFAHGGTGFAVSRPALQRVVQLFNENQEEWETFTHQHWAGDCVLGKAFNDAGAPLLRAWPIWQADDVGDMNYARDEDGLRLWCMPTVSYHHLSPGVVEELWEWEQNWIRETNDASKVLRHKDVYRGYILPKIQAWEMGVRDWDNHAEDDRGPVHSLEICREICEGMEKCLQYKLSSDWRCMTTGRPNLGEVSRGTDSGWIYDRMRAFADDAAWCTGKRSFITS